MCKEKTKKYTLFVKCVNCDRHWNQSIPFDREWFDGAIVGTYPAAHYGSYDKYEPVTCPNCGSSRIRKVEQTERESITTSGVVGKTEDLETYLRIDLQQFARVMEGKLRLNDCKGDWKHCRLYYLVMRLVEKVGELMSCLLDSDKAKDMTIVAEAADAANILMMICDNLGRLKGVM